MTLVFSTSFEGTSWVCCCLGRFFYEFFSINVVLPFIQPGTCPFCRHMLISNASVSWMVVNFMTKNPSFPSWPGVFQFVISFHVILSKSMCIFAFGPFSSPCNSFAMLLIHSLFLLYSLGCHISLQNCSVSLASGSWHVSVSSPPTRW